MCRVSHTIMMMMTCLNITITIQNLNEHVYIHIYSYQFIKYKHIPVVAVAVDTVVVSYVLFESVDELLVISLAGGSDAGWLPVYDSTLGELTIDGIESVVEAAVTVLVVDLMASIAIMKTVRKVDINFLKSHINRFISSIWQERWASCPDNKLFKIMPTLGEWPLGFSKYRQEEVVL